MNKGINNSMAQRKKTRITFFDLFELGQKVISGFSREYSSLNASFLITKVCSVV
jgi:hypothetical protein